MYTTELASDGILAWITFDQHARATKQRNPSQTHGNVISTWLE